MPRNPAHQANGLRKKKTKNARAPETEEEYLQVGVELEESGERWRSGDVLKAGRFFLHAIDAYSTTLSYFPQSFDARYNRARLQYHLTQLPLPPSFFPADSTPHQRLRTAEESHRECLGVEPDNADLLFNYGQVLADLAEFELTDGNVVGVRECYDRSLKAFEHCLDIQEDDFKRSEALALEMAQVEAQDADMELSEGCGVSLSGGAPLERRDSGSSSGGSGQWAAVVEPTTKDTLLDTALAELEMLTSYAATTLGDGELILPVADKLLANYIIPLSTAISGERHTESLLARANFLVARAEGAFKSSVKDDQDSQKTLLQEWMDPIQTEYTPIVATSWQALCDRSTAYAELAKNELIATWKYLSLSATDLSSATKIAPIKNHPEIFLARGNTDLLRSRLDHEQALKNRALLRKNAGVYYRSAVNTGNNGLIGAAASDGKGDVVVEAKVKEAVVRFEDGDKEAVRELIKGGVEKDVVKGVLRVGVEEGLWGVDILNS